MKPKTKVMFNVRRLVHDCGGATAFAYMVGHSRSWVYFAINNRYVSSRVLELVREAKPRLNINRYFEKVETGDERDS